MKTENEVESFRQRMADHGLDPGEIVPDGVIYRFPTWGDAAGEESGAYWHNGKVGWFQDWRSMEKPEIVHGELSEADRAALNGSFTGSNNKVSREALEAGIRRIWKAGTEPDGHPYLIRKGITAPPEVKQHDGCLVIPILGANNELNGLQRIDADGRKRFLTGTRKKSSMFGIKGNGNYIICEGFSTGVSLHMATGASIAVAFDAGNLLHVARAVSKKVSPEDIIVAGDDDRENVRNIGAEMAQKAAQDIGCRLILPEFQNPNGKKTTDFNDLHHLEGLDVVKLQVESAKVQRNLEDEIRAIADLPILKREVEVIRIADDHKISKGIINKFIKELHKDKKIDGAAAIMAEVDPWETKVDGADLLNNILDRLNKHVILPDGAAPPISVWILNTYCFDAFWICPILGIVSPVKRCGKTTLQETMQGMVNKGVPASNITPAVVYRIIQEYGPTLLVDEADTFLKGNEELRGVLNSGHSRLSAWIWRSEGDDHQPKVFSTWAPKTISMIGVLPSTIEDRAIVISLHRKTAGEAVSQFGMNYKEDCAEIRRKCRRWADDNFNKLLTTKPEIIKTSNDRMANNWTPLCAIAEVAGGEWPELIRKSMSKMIKVSDDDIGPMMLEDIQDIFKSRRYDRIFSNELVEALNDISERPWCDWNQGKGLTQNGLARILKPFHVYSKNMRIGENLRKGYDIDSFIKSGAFTYIPSLTPSQGVTTLQDNNINKINQNQNVTRKNDVTLCKQDKQLKLNDCYVVTDETGVAGEKTEMPESLRGRIDPKLAEEIYGGAE